MTSEASINYAQPFECDVAIAGDANAVDLSTDSALEAARAILAGCSATAPPRGAWV